MRNIFKKALSLRYILNRYKDHIICKRFFPKSIILPDYIRNKSTVNMYYNRSQKDIYQSVKHACSVVKNIYSSLESSDILKPGITTKQIDEFVYMKCLEHSVYPSPLGYKGFPRSVCTSLNEVVCHGIPGDICLRNGDVLSIDVSVFNGEAHGDSCRTYMIGEGSDCDKILIKATEQCLSMAIGACKNGQYFSAIGDIIETTANTFGASTIRNITGHGIGKDLHEDPQILHHKNDDKSIMKSGLIFTIEPCLTFGEPDVMIEDDDWSIRTIDRSNVAQFEHTIYINETGCEILT